MVAQLHAHENKYLLSVKFSWREHWSAVQSLEKIGSTVCACASIRYHASRNLFRKISAPLRPQDKRTVIHVEPKMKSFQSLFIVITWSYALCDLRLLESRMRTIPITARSMLSGVECSRINLRWTFLLQVVDILPDLMRLYSTSTQSYTIPDKFARDLWDGRQAHHPFMVAAIAQASLCSTDATTKVEIVLEICYLLIRSDSFRASESCPNKFRCAMGLHHPEVWPNCLWKHITILC